MSAVNAGEDRFDFLSLILDESAGKGRYFSLSTPNFGDTHHFGWNCCTRVNATSSASLSTVSHALLDTIINNCLSIATVRTVWRENVVKTLNKYNDVPVCNSTHSLVALHSLEKVKTGPPVWTSTINVHPTSRRGNLTITAFQNIPRFFICITPFFTQSKRSFEISII